MICRPKNFPLIQTYKHVRASFFHTHTPSCIIHWAKSPIWMDGLIDGDGLGLNLDRSPGERRRRFIHTHAEAREEKNKGANRSLRACLFKQILILIRTRVGPTTFGGTPTPVSRQPRAPFSRADCWACILFLKAQAARHAAAVASTVWRPEESTTSWFAPAHVLSKDVFVASRPTTTPATPAAPAAPRTSTSPRAAPYIIQRLGRWKSDAWKIYIRDRPYLHGPK
jgi:hypothetical protein